MTLPRLAAMNAYWREHPPLALMIEAYLGIKPARKRRMSRDAARSFAASIRGAMR